MDSQEEAQELLLQQQLLSRVALVLLSRILDQLSLQIGPFLLPAMHALALNLPNVAYSAETMALDSSPGNSRALSRPLAASPSASSLSSSA